LYAHLSEASVKVGDEVTLGQALGKTGTTGLSQSEEVWFELRVHDVPISPNEWWDPTWVKDHIDNKISFVQRALIGAPGE
jgi:murein DD-endopeptidase MepM/ murein hydrolase activator NlpD